MKKLEQIKNEVAVKHGAKSWEGLLFYQKDLCIDEVATEYAAQCCDEQIKACAEKAKTKIVVPPLTRDEQYVTIDKDSILNTPNVVTTK